MLSNEKHAKKFKSNDAYLYILITTKQKKKLKWKFYLSE